MDVELLSKMVGQIILDKDAVTLPGVGTFFAEVVPSTFSDKGYTINPPYRRLSFRQREEGDASLVDLYARSNGIDAQAARSILTSFLSGLKEELLQKKTIVLPGLGRLRATRENHLFFVPDEDLNIYPDGFGLASVSLKTHEETEDEVADAISSLTSIIASPSAPVAEGPSPAVEATAPAVVEQAAPAVQEPSAPAVETTASPAPETPAAQEAAKAEEPVEVKVEATASPAQETPAAQEVAKAEEPVAVAVEEPAEVKVEATVPEAPGTQAAPASQVAEKAEEPVAVAAEEPAEVKVEAQVVPQTRSVGRMLLIVCAVLLALLVVYMLLGRIAPGLIDPLLYTPEELEIIRS